MIELRTLGSLDLLAARRPGSRDVVSQPKRMALLAYLAVAEPRGLKRRDTLMALFWPDSDADHARRVLRQTVYLLRRALGGDAVISRGGEEVGINPEALRSDVGQFEEALAQGRLAEALELYRGDFLSGFHPPGVAGEMEEWIASERRRLRAAAASAAWTLASREEQRGRLGASDGGVHWARRAVALDRDNEDAVKDLMLLLARRGDRAGALRVFEDHAHRLREEFGIEAPGHALQQAVTALRAPIRVEMPAAPALTVALPAEAPVVEPVTVPSPPPAAGRRRAPSRRSLVVGAAGALVLAGLYALVLWRGSASRTPVLAVGPIVEISGADSVGDAAALGDLLSTSLARLPRMEVIPAARLHEVQAELAAAGSASTGVLTAARLAGARQLARGTLRTSSRGGSRLDLQVVDLASGRVIRAFSAEGDDIFALVDHATTLVATGFGVPIPAAPITSVTTSSAVAYRLYQEGLRAYYASDGRAALGLFRAAIDEDSAFAMAEYYAALAGFDERDSAAETHLRRAAQLAGRAPDRERLLIAYRVAEREQSPAAVSLAETLAVRYPKDPDAQYALGAVQTWNGDFAAAAATYRRVIALDSLGLAADRGRCLACEAYLQLWYTFLYADSGPAAERVAREYLRRRGLRSAALSLLAQALAREDRVAEAAAAWRTADSVGGLPGANDLPASALAIRAGDFARADSILDARYPRATPAGRTEVVWLKAISLRAQGRLREALALDLPPQMRALVLLESGRAREAAALFSRVAYAMPVGTAGGWARNRVWNLTHVATCAAAAGDTARLALLADSLEGLGSFSAFGRDARLHHYVRGLLWAARGDMARAADEYRRSVWSWSDGYTRANYELARTALALGRPADATFPLQAALRGDLESSNLYVTRTELHELLADAFAALGRRDSAAAHYAAVARAWRRADPAFTARRVRAQAYLARR